MGIKYIQYSLTLSHNYVKHLKIVYIYISYT